MATRLSSAVLFCMVITFQGLAQAPPLMEFGKISKQELEMTTYEKDTGAVAVVLFDYGRFTPERSTRHTRIKILKPEGLWYANGMEVVFKQEGFRSLKGATYNLVNGRMVETKLDDGSVFKEKFNEIADFMKFAMPQVRAGSVIEFKYDLIPQGNVVYVGGRDWTFQRKIPTIWSEFIFERFVNAEYNKLVQGYHPLTTFEEKGHAWRWVMKDIPSFRKESFAPADENFMAKARVSMTYYRLLELNTTWENIARIYHKSVFADGNVESSRFLKDDATTIASKETTAQGKAAAIYDYVKKHIEWDDVESTRIQYAKTVYEKRLGNSGDINLVLLAMLRYADLEAYPVLISTRENGFVRKEFPEARQFDRVIVQVMIDQQPVLLDATDRLLPMEFLPEPCLNGEGLLIESLDKVKWVELKGSAKQRSVVSVTGEMELNATGELAGKVSISRTGYAARLSRKDHLEKGEQRYKLHSLAQHQPEITGASITGLDEPSKPVKEDYAFKLNGYTTIANDIIYLDPVLFNRLDQAPVVAAERTYPIDLVSPGETVTMLKFKIPDGYRVEELPKPHGVMLPNAAGRFSYNVSEKDGVISFVSQFVLSKALFSQVEYAVVREFYKSIAAKQEAQIVIKKKT